MAVIVHIKNLKDTNKFSSFCAKQKEPVCVTKNGYGDMVVINIDYYEKVVENILLEKKYLKALSIWKKEELLMARKQ